MLVEELSEFQCGLQAGCALGAYSKWVNNCGHMCFGTVGKDPVSWWFRFWGLCHYLVGLKMYISHLLQEY